MSQPEIPRKNTETENAEKPGMSQGQLVKDIDPEEYEKFEEPPENDCDSSHLLYRKTESFRCLQQILLSSSAVLHNKDFRFPPLHDPGINEAFYYVGRLCCSSFFYI